MSAADGVSAWQVVAAVFYVAVLAGLGLAIVHFARRGAPWRPAQASRGALRVVESTRLSPTVSVALVEVDGRQVLVASTTSGTSMIELSPKPGHE